MKYANIIYNDIVNGPGVRVSLFVTGCTHHCKGCFNSEAWDFDFGEEFTPKTRIKIIDTVAHEYISGLTLLGGEPLEPSNIKELIPLIETIKRLYPDKTIWCYTGYDFEKDILSYRINTKETINRFLNSIDVLVDGEFVEDLKVLNLKFRGSTNQRIIDVKKSLENNSIVLYE